MSATSPATDGQHSTPALIADGLSSPPSDVSPLTSPGVGPTMLPATDPGASVYQSERYKSREDISQWAGSLTLLDTLETYFDSRIDLLERRFKQHSDRWKRKAGIALKRTTSEALKRTKTPTAELSRLYDERSKEFEVELAKYKQKLQDRMSTVQKAWESATVVRTREKVDAGLVSFFYGVMMVLASALMFGLAPEWIHVVYSVHVLYFLPTRFYVYKKKHWHYFLFDLCYYAQILCLAYLWVAPGNTTLWVAAYLLAHGSLASAVITWRNSLVFHDLDKVISLFIHIYPPLVFTVIRHFYPNVETRFPAAAKVKVLEAGQSLFLNTIIYLIWQTLYWKFVLVNKRKKIESGQRTTSFSFLLNEQRGVIGKVLGATPPRRREMYFMLGQLLYSILTSLPAVFLLYTSAKWSGAFLLLIFSVSVWNGGGYYIEVFGRKFERELESLRKELAEATAAGYSSSGANTPHSRSEQAQKSHHHSDTGDETSSSEGSPLIVGGNPDVVVEDLSLDASIKKNQ
ncbi:membrane protein [Ceratobasidium sp. AG-Ba]|nr:membrane protein [Ceratobasidium sp. AG-Ba]